MYPQPSTQYVTHGSNTPCEVSWQEFYFSGKPAPRPPPYTFAHRAPPKQQVQRCAYSAVPLPAAAQVLHIKLGYHIAKELSHVKRDPLTLVPAACARDALAVAS